MQRTLFFFFAIWVFLCLSGCGYFSSGTWNDAPENWERAFHTQKPDDVVVLHSQFWQSSHFTSEFRYFFEIAAHQNLENQLLSENDLVELKDVQRWDVSGALQDAPEWFVSKSIDNYEIFRYRDKEGRKFFVFIDTENRNIYLTDYQF